MRKAPQKFPKYDVWENCRLVNYLCTGRTLMHQVHRTTLPDLTLSISSGCSAVSFIISFNKLVEYVCTLSCVGLFATPWTVARHGLLCPRNFPPKNPGVGCHFPLQGIFLTQGSNPHLLHWQVDSLPLRHLGSPPVVDVKFNSCVICVVKT